MSSTGVIDCPVIEISFTRILLMPGDKFASRPAQMGPVLSQPGFNHQMSAADDELPETLVRLRIVDTDGNVTERLVTMDFVENLRAIARGTAGLQWA